MADGRRVAVTGLGALSPVGNTAAESWRAATEGKSGIAALSRFDAAGFSVRIAGEVRGFNPGDYLPEKKARHMDLFIHYGIAAGMQAVTDSGLSDSESDPQRIGVAIGSGIGGLRMIEQVQDIYRKNGGAADFAVFCPGNDY